MSREQNPATHDAVRTLPNSDWNPAIYSIPGSDWNPAIYSIIKPSAPNPKAGTWSSDLYHIALIPGQHLQSENEYELLDGAGQENFESQCDNEV